MLREIQNKHRALYECQRAGKRFTTLIKGNWNYRPAVVYLCQPVKLQFTSMSVQTHKIYVVKTLKEFNIKGIKCIFWGEMEVITVLTCMIAVNNFQ